MILATSIAFFALSVVSFIFVGRAVARIEDTKRRGREEDRQTLDQRRKQPLVLVSYRKTELETAEAIARVLVEQGYEVVQYDPGHPWVDPVWTVINSMGTANAIVYVSGSSSDWIRAKRSSPNRCAFRRSPWAPSTSSTRCLRLFDKQRSVQISKSGSPGALRTIER